MWIAELYWNMYQFWKLRRSFCRWDERKARFMKFIQMALIESHYFD